ncbi:unnamed protein product [Malus baccata var. baccata]
MIHWLCYRVKVTLVLMGKGLLVGIGMVIHLVIPMIFVENMLHYRQTYRSHSRKIDINRYFNEKGFSIVISKNEGERVTAECFKKLSKEGWHDVIESGVIRSNGASFKLTLKPTEIVKDKYNLSWLQH